MANIPELLDGHVTLEVECLDRLCLNGYIGGLATPGGLVTFMRVQLGKPIPSPVVLGQVSEKFREAVKTEAERQQIPVYQFQHKERKDDIANDFRRKRGVRDQIVFVGVTDPINPVVETAAQVRDRVIQAAFFINAPKQLGTTDDCGFSPFADDNSTARDTAFAKITARVRGTELAAKELGY